MEGVHLRDSAGLWLELWEGGDACEGKETIYWKQKRKQGRASRAQENLNKPCREVMRERESPECSLNGRIDG